MGSGIYRGARERLGSFAEHLLLESVCVASGEQNQVRDDIHASFVRMCNIRWVPISGTRQTSPNPVEFTSLTPEVQTHHAMPSPSWNHVNLVFFIKVN